MISKIAVVAALLAVVVTIVSAQDPTESSPIITDRPERSEAEEVFDSLVVSGRADIRAVIAELRRKLDRRLVDFFPELKEKIEKLHGDIDACYDQTVAHNVTVNIFEAKVHDIVKKFFVSWGVLFGCYCFCLTFFYFFSPLLRKATATCWRTSIARRSTNG